MRSIRASFLQQVEKNPDYSSFVCFGKAIEGRKFSKDTICRGFNKLVDKNDYFNNKNLLLNHLVRLSDSLSRRTTLEKNINSKALKKQSG